MKKIYLLLFLGIAGTFISTAQNRDTKKADQHFDRLEYIKAAEEYEKIVEREKADEYVYTRLANSYYYINDTQKAEPYFKEAVATTNNPETVYSYAQTLKANGKSEESNIWMKKFAQMAPNDSRAIAFNENPNYIPKLMDKAEKFEVNIVGELQSEHTDFGGEMLGNKFYFTSSRNTARKNHKMNQEPFLDIYEATNTAGTFTDIKPLKGDVNTKFHEGVLSFSKDGKRMYFDRNDYFDGKYKKNEEGINQLNIYYAELVDGVWKDIQSVPFNNSEYSVGHPAVSADGKTLYFVSDMPGGFGESDIYEVSINDDGSFGEPKNLGKNINTEAKEVFPFVGKNGTLYFSSNGHLGLGGLDVFYAEESSNGFGKAMNLGSPVNGKSDDFAFKYDDTSKEGFVSSNRNGEKDNIFKLKEICSSTIESIVINEYTNEPLSGAKVDLYDSNENLLSSKIAGNDGRVSFEVECDQDFVVQGSMADFESNAVTGLKSDKSKVAAEIKLRPIEDIIVEDKVVLNPIMFDYDKYNIKPQGALELDKLVQLMKKYPKMVIKVEGHTDNKGPAEYNRDLSDKRAKSTVQYVISKGIDESRISGEGFGESQPIFDCGDSCTPEKDAKNRRSEFIIISR
ncbi:OmpA family protein [Aequorivita echinoideorum]|uniref:OmpA family protein n=1 Tax=Aequorivita echinoideorum TaxID=1549647 RepID=A0ABS5S254_9FLAO|nr:OmpA family protein [Aequorivita echinoideorum]MBT0607273.1 OmpA family protein [Aequorivita echinoideorum]